MGYVPTKKKGILIPCPDLHLFVVMNDPCPEKLCLVISISSIKPKRHFDPACVLEVGDHPFIKHPSFIMYRLAETKKAMHISNMVDSKYYLKHKDFEEPAFGNIAAGLFKSDEVKPRILKYADAVGL